MGQQSLYERGRSGSGRPIRLLQQIDMPHNVMMAYRYADEIGGIGTGGELGQDGDPKPTPYQPESGRHEVGLVTWLDGKAIAVGELFDALSHTALAIGNDQRVLANLPQRYRLASSKSVIGRYKDDESVLKERRPSQLFRQPMPRRDAEVCLPLQDQLPDPLGKHIEDNDTDGRMGLSKRPYHAWKSLSGNSWQCRDGDGPGSCR